MRTFEIIEQIINSMSMAVEVNTSTATTINVDNVLSMRVGRIISDGVNNFKIKGIVGKVVTLSPVSHSIAWSGDFAYLNEPTFLQGEWMSANSEFLMMNNNTFKKTPLIWLVRGYKEDFKSRENNIKFSVSPVIYFLEETPESGWLNSEHDQNAINPMYNLCVEFIKTLQTFANIGELNNGYEITDKPRFGVKVGNKGSEKLILDDYLSGVELRIDLDIYNNC